MDRYAQSLILLILTVLIGCSAANSTGDAPSAQQLAAATAAAEVPGFRPIRLGGGGFVVDLDFSPDGRTRIARTDVHGAYLWDESAGEWKQLITGASMPAGDQFLRTGNSISVYAIRVAPSNSSRLYMVLPATEGIPSYVYRSDDRGAHWIRTKFAPVEMAVLGSGRLAGPKMAVDPHNPDLVLLGDSAGRIYRTADGGTSWTTVAQSQIPLGADPAIAFGKSDGARSSEVFVTNGSNGVYRSTDGGLSWAPTQGGPRSIIRLVAASDGLYATDRDNISPQNAWKLAAGRWNRLTIDSRGDGNGWHSIAVDPADSRHIVLGLEGGNIASSFDAGETWISFDPTPPKRVAKDVPWLAWTLEDWMSNGNMMFDPVIPNRLYFAQGIGVWYTHPTSASAAPKWISQTRGIDELIVNDLLVPPGGKPILAVQDRGVFRIESPELFPATHGPDRDKPIRHAWSLDYAAEDPSFLAMIANGGAADRSGFSTDGGRTWSPFESNSPSTEPGNLGGTIAVSSRQNIVWAPANNGRPFYTLNGGRTWQIARFPADIPTTGELGWSFSLYQNRHIFAADRVQKNTFYGYNYGPSVATSVAGTYRSTDGGATWVKVSSGFGFTGTMGLSARLASVPGFAGHLFFAPGTTAMLGEHPNRELSLKQSRDGGSSWQDVRRTQEVWAIGFGKAAPGKTYPAIYIAGFANGDRDPAIYRSIDEGSSWQKLVSYPSGNIDGVRAISGDINAYGRIYFGFSGSGAGYGIVDDGVTGGRDKSQ